MYIFGKVKVGTGIVTSSGSYSNGLAILIY